MGMSDVCAEGKHHFCQNVTLYGWPSCECGCHKNANVSSNTERFKYFADEPKAVIPAGIKLELSCKTTIEMMYAYPVDTHTHPC